MKRDIQIGDEIFNIALVKNASGHYFKLNEGGANNVDLTHLSGDLYRITMGEKSSEIKIITKGEEVFIEAFNQVFNLSVLNPVEQAQSAGETNDLSVKAAMPGVIVEVNVQEGDVVEAEQAILTMESMKLFTVIKSKAQGKVTAINYHEGDSFNKGVVLVEIISLEKTEE